MGHFYDCITEFLFVENEPARADIIFVPGGNYPEAAVHAAELYCQGYAPYVLPSGKYSILKGKFEPEKPGTEKFATEWEYLRSVLTAHGVPEAAILREDQATYTYENAIYSRKRTDAEGITVSRAILCCQAFHTRRCLLYYQEQFPEAEILVCPVVTRGISRENWHQSETGIDMVLGELERCGGQFHEIMRKYISQGTTPAFPGGEQKIR